MDACHSPRQGCLYNYNMLTWLLYQTVADISVAWSGYKAPTVCSLVEQACLRLDMTLPHWASSSQTPSYTQPHREEYKHATETTEMHVQILCLSLYTLSTSEASPSTL